MKHGTIKLVAMAAVALTILTAPVLAQGKRGGGGGEPPKADDTPKVDEKAYKAAMERIPEPKQKYDPWGVVAPAPAPTTPAAKKK